MNDLHGRAEYIEVEAEPRYWEDATVGGTQDTKGTLVPGRRGDLWLARVRLRDGTLEGWPDGTQAHIHYKVCDAGLYWLLDGEGRRIARRRGNYVPSTFLCHGAQGYGDYIILSVGADGRIAGYVRPEVLEEEWEGMSP